MTSDLTTKAAEIRAGLVERLRDDRHCNDWYLRQEAAALIAQQAAELAEANRLFEATLESSNMFLAKIAEMAEENRTLKAERDELLREKERLGAALEPFARADRALGRTPGSDRTFRLVTDTGYREIDRDAFRRARSVLENSKAGLADANSKSPAPSSQSERIAVLEAALRFYACDPETCDCRPGEEQSDRVLCGYRARAALPQEPAALAPLGEG